MSAVIELFPFAKKTKEDIEYQNKLLSKVSLTGKINANNFSANLFEYTDQTIEKFEILKEELIESLVTENHTKVYEELSLKAQLSIDVLKRNLFERTADVGFLATDGEIIKFLESDNIDIADMQDRLQEYVKKYSVYDDVLIFDTKGNLKVNINEQNTLSHSSDKILHQALNSETFIEQYDHTDIIKYKNKALLYAQKIVSQNKTIGILCLSFKLKDELEKIFSGFDLKDEIIALEDSNGVISSSNPKQIRENSRITFTKMDNTLLYKNRFFSVKVKTKGYQGYTGLDWSCIAIATNIQESQPNSEKSVKLTPKLQQIIDEAHERVDDLSDVIINGELTASKYREYTLSPILDNLRTISDTLLENINTSAASLTNIITAGLLSSTNIASKFAIDLMDRNLYERANDCRWWALTPLFIHELSNKTPNIQNLTSTLKYINELYTVYTDIFLYDTTGTIIATSYDQSLVNMNISQTAVSATLQNRNSQHYFVSPFEKTKLYKNEPTYVYHASITNDTKVVGGIGIVFDSSIEFKNMLTDSMLENKRGFSFFCDASQNIIASTHPTLKPLDKLNLPQSYFQHKDVFQKFITFEDKEYLLTIAPSKGYREYKIQDNYTNEVFVATFIEV